MYLKYNYIQMVSKSPLRNSMVLDHPFSGPPHVGGRRSPAPLRSIHKLRVWTIGALTEADVPCLRGGIPGSVGDLPENLDSEVSRSRTLMARGSTAQTAGSGSGQGGRRAARGTTAQGAMQGGRGERRAPGADGTRAGRFGRERSATERLAEDC